MEVINFSKCPSCGSDETNFVVQCLSDNLKWSVYSVECRACYHLEPFRTASYANSEEVMAIAIDTWNEKINKKPTKHHINIKQQ